MRKCSAALVAIVVLAVIAAASPVDSANKLIDRYKGASGKQAGDLKSTQMTGSIKLADGTAGRFTLLAIRPDRLRIDLDAPGRKFSECYNGKSAWLQDDQGLRTLLGREAHDLRLLGLILNLRLRDLGRYKIVAGPGPSGSVKLSFRGAESVLSFDPATHLISKIDRGTLDPLPTLVFAGYKSVDRVMEPSSITIGDGESAIAVTVDSVKHNLTVESGRFEYPNVSGRPLPDVGELLKSLIPNQEKIEHLQEHYTFREVQTERVLDGSGKLKETHEKTFDVTPVAGRLVERLVAENGKALSASDQEKEDRRVQKEVQDILKREENRKRKADEDKENKERKRDRVTVLSFLKISEITSERWEKLGGKDVVAFDFEPRPNYKASNRSEELISKLAGTMWIDPESKQVARLQAHFTESFKIGAGLLASVGPATAFAFEQKNVDGEVWLPSYSEINISARVLLMKRFNRAFATVYSNYKKYQINSTYKVNPPAENKKNLP